jgi:hypothetical protein
MKKPININVLPTTVSFGQNQNQFTIQKPKRRETVDQYFD